MNQKKNLLPIGFRDILSNEANTQFEYWKKLLKNFDSWGYSFIDPPIVEYEKTLLDTKNKSLNKKTLSFSDPLTKEKTYQTLFGSHKNGFIRFNLNFTMPR